MKIKTLIAGVCILTGFLLASQTFAKTQTDYTNTKYYVGVGGGLTFANGDTGGNLQAFGGYNITHNIAVELGYIQADTSDTTWFSTVTNHANIYSLAAQYNYHINDRLVWSAKLGAAYLRENATLEILSEKSTTPTQSGVLPLVGTSLDFYWSKHISTGAGVVYMPTSHKLQGGVDGDVNLAFHF